MRIILQAMTADQIIQHGVQAGGITGVNHAEQLVRPVRRPRRAFVTQRHRRFCRQLAGDGCATGGIVDLPHTHGVVA